jgi:hypothetical protein
MRPCADIGEHSTWDKIHARSAGSMTPVLDFGWDRHSALRA